MFFFVFFCCCFFSPALSHCFDGVRNVTGGIDYSRKRVSDCCSFMACADTYTQNKTNSHTSQKMKQHDISSRSLYRQGFAKSSFILNIP